MRELNEPKREALVYARVKTVNRKMVDREAKRHGVTIARYIDYILDCHRDILASKSKKSK